MAVLNVKTALQPYRTRLLLINSKLWMVFTILVVVFLGYPEVSNPPDFWACGIIVVLALLFVLVSCEVYLKLIKKR